MPSRTSEGSISIRLMPISPRQTSVSRADITVREVTGRLASHAVSLLKYSLDRAWKALNTSVQSMHIIITSVGSSSGCPMRTRALNRQFSNTARATARPSSPAQPRMASST